MLDQKEEVDDQLIYVPDVFKIVYDPFVSLYALDFVIDEHVLKAHSSVETMAEVYGLVELVPRVRFFVFCKQNGHVDKVLELLRLTAIWVSDFFKAASSIQKSLLEQTTFTCFVKELLRELLVTVCNANDCSPSFVSCLVFFE